MIGTVRARRIVMRIVIAVSVAALVALVAVRPLRQHAPGGGWGIWSCAAVGVLASLYYLRSTRGRS